MPYSKIIGSGSVLPDKVLTNDDLAKMVDTSHQWIIERTGIIERRIASHDESNVFMAEIASRRALEMAELKPSDIDAIIIGTTTPDQYFPSTACLLQKQLGITNRCPAFDISAACAGFIYSLSIADAFIKTGQYKTVMVLGSEILSRLLNWEDRSTCILFGDGAGAMILTASDEPGIFSTHIHAAGQYDDLLYTKNPYTHPDSRTDAPKLVMSGNEVFKYAVKLLGEVILETLHENDMQKSDIDWLVPHQANIRIISAMAKKLNMPMEKVIVTIDKHGNTSSASIPLAFDSAIRSNKIKRGDNIIMESFGGGFTWGSALIKY